MAIYISNPTGPGTPTNPQPNPPSVPTQTTPAAPTPTASNPTPVYTPPTPTYVVTPAPPPVYGPAPVAGYPGSPGYTSPTTPTTPPNQQVVYGPAPVAGYPGSPGYVYPTQPTNPSSGFTASPTYPSDFIGPPWSPTYVEPPSPTPSPVEFIGPEPVEGFAGSPTYVAPKEFKASPTQTVDYNNLPVSKQDGQDVVQLRTGEYLSKGDYDELSNKDQTKINQVGVKKYNTDAEEQKAAINQIEQAGGFDKALSSVSLKVFTQAGYDPAEVTNLQTNYVQVEPGKYINKKDYETLTPSDRDSIKTLGYDKWSQNQQQLATDAEALKSGDYTRDNVLRLRNANVINTEDTIYWLKDDQLNDQRNEVLRQRNEGLITADQAKDKLEQLRIEKYGDAAKDPIKRLLAAEKEVVISMIPVYGTIHNWETSSNLQKGISLAGDALFLVPWAKGAGTFSRLGYGGLESAGRSAPALGAVINTVERISKRSASAIPGELGRLAVAEVKQVIPTKGGIKTAIQSVTDPIALVTQKDRVSFPVMSQHYFTVRAPIEQGASGKNVVTTPRETLLPKGSTGGSQLSSLVQRRDEAVSTLLQGKQATISLPETGSKITLDPARFTKSIRVGTMTSSPDIRNFMNKGGIDVGLQADGSFVPITGEVAQKGALFTTPTGMMQRFISKTATGREVPILQETQKAINAGILPNEKISGGLLITSKKVLNDMQGGTPGLYRGTLEVENTLPPKYHLPEPIEYLRMRDDTGNLVTIAHIGDTKFTQAELAKMKFLGVPEQIKQMFSRPYGREALSEVDQQTLTKLTKQQDSARASGNTKQVDELENQIEDIRRRAGIDDTYNRTSVSMPILIYSGDQNITRALEEFEGRSSTSRSSTNERPRVSLTQINERPTTAEPTRTRVEAPRATVQRTSLERPTVPSERSSTISIERPTGRTPSIERPNVPNPRTEPTPRVPGGPSRTPRTGVTPEPTRVPPEPREPPRRGQPGTVEAPIVPMTPILTPTRPRKSRELPIDKEQRKLVINRVFPNTVQLQVINPLNNQLIEVVKSYQVSRSPEPVLRFGGIFGEEVVEGVSPARVVYRDEREGLVEAEVLGKTDQGIQVRTPSGRKTFIEEGEIVEER